MGNWVHAIVTLRFDVGRRWTPSNPQACTNPMLSSCLYSCHGVRHHGVSGPTNRLITPTQVFALILTRPGAGCALPVSTVRPRHRFASTIEASERREMDFTAKPDANGSTKRTPLAISRQIKQCWNPRFSRYRYLRSEELSKTTTTCMECTQGKRSDQALPCPAHTLQETGWLVLHPGSRPLPPHRMHVFFFESPIRFSFSFDLNTDHLVR